MFSHTSGAAGSTAAPEATPIATVHSSRPNRSLHPKQGYQGQSASLKRAVRTGPRLASANNSLSSWSLSRVRTRTATAQSASQAAVTTLERRSESWTRSGAASGASATPFSAPLACAITATFLFSAPLATVAGQSNETRRDETRRASVCSSPRRRHRGYTLWPRARDSAPRPPLYAVHPRAAPRQAPTWQARGAAAAPGRMAGLRRT